MTKKRLPCIISGCNYSHLDRPNGLCVEHNRLTPEFKARQKINASKPEAKIKNREYSSKYRSKPEVKESRAARQKQPKQRYKILCTRAKIKNQSVELTLDQHTWLTSLPCTYCGGFSPGENYVGIDRVDSYLGYTIGNSLPCCSSCNYMKAEITVWEFLTHCSKIVEFQRGIKLPTGDSVGGPYLIESMKIFEKLYKSGVCSNVEGAGISEVRWDSGTTPAESGN